MKAPLKKLFLLLTLFSTCSAFAQNTPYPIIFLHGINSDNNTWGVQDNKYDDVIDYLAGGGLKFGGKIDIALSYKRSAASLSISKEEDVHLFTNPPAADFYTINYNVHASGKIPVVHKFGPLVLKPAISGSVTAAATQFNVSYPTEFLAGDIIRVENEFMQVTAVSGSKLTVTRGIYGTTVVKHGGVTVYNISNLSNQASIVKQAYGLKLAIDAVKQKTGALKVILVGHSMGGLAIREYLKQYYGYGDVAKIVTIGTPHYGTNITDLSPSILSLLNIEGKSDAIRDMRATIPASPTVPGVYLFGGAESLVKNTKLYFNGDINANGTETDNISGVNDSRGLGALKGRIAKTWVASTGDGIVPFASQYITTADTLMINKFHTSETTDYPAIMRGLDEPSVDSLAYTIGNNSVNKGFITYNKNTNPADTDVFKIVLQENSIVNISLTGNPLCGVKTFTLRNGNKSEFTGTSLAIRDTLFAGTYFIKITGVASNSKLPSYKYPYTLTPNITKAVPAGSVTYGTPDFNPKPGITGITYTSNNPKVATIVNGKIHTTGVGFATITGKVNGVTLSGLLLVNRANLFVTADNKTRVEGTPNPAFTVSYSGFKNGDTPASLQKQPVITCDATISSPPGYYMILANGIVANNYNLSIGSGTLTITPKPAGLMAFDLPDNSRDIQLNTALSPNADGVNDYLQIDNISQYPANRVLITNSKGIKVFEASGYDNITKRFEGISSTSHQRLPAGTYFYTIAYEKKQKAGYLVIKY